MKLHLPKELTDPLVRETTMVPHGEVLTIDVLMSTADALKADWLALHPGWSFTRTALVPCADGSSPPCYDLALEFQRPRTMEELETQAQQRSDWVVRKEADYRRREEEQKALLAEVLASMRH